MQVDEAVEGGFTSKLDWRSVETLTFGEFIGAQPPILKEIIGNNLLVTEGRLLMYGPYGCGKSNMGIQLATCIAMGKNFLMLPCTQCNTYMVNLEMNKWQWRKRLEKHFINNGGIYPTNMLFATEFNLKLDKEEGVQKLAGELTKHPEIDFLWIDPLIKCISGNISDSQAMVKFCDNMDLIILKFKVAVGIATHTRKTVFSKMGEKIDLGAEEILGSNVLPGWADTIIGIKPKVGGIDMIDMQFQKIRYSEHFIPPLSLHFNREHLCYKIV